MQGWGVAVLVGVPNKDDAFKTHPVNFLNERTLKGTFYGNYKPRSDLPSVVDMYMRGVNLLITGWLTTLCLSSCELKGDKNFLKLNCRSWNWRSSLLTRCPYLRSTRHLTTCWKGSPSGVSFAWKSSWTMPCELYSVFSLQDLSFLCGDGEQIKFPIKLVVSIVFYKICAVYHSRELNRPFVHRLKFRLLCLPKHIVIIHSPSLVYVYAIFVWCFCFGNISSYTFYELK